MGSNSGSSGMTGGTSDTSGYGIGMGSSTTAGPHSSNLANKTDPRVDSDLGTDNLHILTYYNLL